MAAMAEEGAVMATTGRRTPRTALFVLELLVVPTRAEALELSCGVSLGLIQAGTVPHLAVGPHAGASWRIKKLQLAVIPDDGTASGFPAGRLQDPQESPTAGVNGIPTQTLHVHASGGS
jgi:hypothetical protein